LIQLNADNEIGVLHALQAQAALAQITYERDKRQFAVQAISKQQLDTDIQNLKNLEGQVFAQAATVKKKTINAPFTGRLGVNFVNPGQYLNPGDTVASLQTLDPIWADFYLPQQTISQLKIGLTSTVTTDTFPGKKYVGKVTTIEPNVDTSTRNILIEATIANPKYELVPGMFATVTVETGGPQRHLTLPQTAVTFNPYGNIVYVVKESGKDEKGKPILIAKQAFVITGETRGEQVAILSGLKEGDTVVSSGQLKLKNGSKIAVNNSIVPSNSKAPKAPDEY
jgi:membrane fusion protein (multidrug efflux system)